MSSGKIIKRIFIILGVVILLAIIGGVIYVPTLLKHRIVSHINEHSNYTISIENVSFAGHRSLELRGIRFRSKPEKGEYIRNKEYQISWMDCKIASLSLSGIDWQALIFNNRFYADRVLIWSPEIYIFKDKGSPVKYRYRGLPAALLREAAYPFSIAIGEIKNGQILYEESNPKEHRRFSIPFSKLYASFYHMSSDSFYLMDQPMMTVDAQGMIYDSIRAAIVYISNTLNDNNVFTMEGTMGKFSAKLLNPFIPASSGMEIKSGVVNHIYFKFVANEDVANGTMKMDHRNLKVEMKRKEGDQDEEVKIDDEPKKKNRFKTFLANIFVRDEDKSKEKDKDKLTRMPVVSEYTGRIHFTRKKDRYIFDYWLNAFKTGIVSTISKAPNIQQKFSQEE